MVNEWLINKPSEDVHDGEVMVNDGELMLNQW